MKYWMRISIPTLLILLILLNGLLLIQRQYLNAYLLQDYENNYKEQIEVQASTQAAAISMYLVEQNFTKRNVDISVEEFEETVKEIIQKLLTNIETREYDGTVIPDYENYLRSIVDAIKVRNNYEDRGISGEELEQIVYDVLNELFVRHLARIEGEEIIEDGYLTPEEFERYTREIVRAVVVRLPDRLFLSESEKVRSLISNYVNNQPYEDNGIFLRLYNIPLKKGSSQNNTDSYIEYYKSDHLQKNSVNIEDLENGDVKIVNTILDGTLGCVMCELPGFKGFKLMYIQSLIEHSWDRVFNLLQLFGLVASVLVAVILMLSMWKMSKPVSDLTAATREIALGDRSHRIDPVGWGEVAELASLFNSMADETQRLELVEEDAERKQRFLDSFTHELRTPLTNIHGYSELMKRVQLSEEDRLRYLDYVMHESRRLNRLSEELFGLTVLRENTTKMERVSCGRLLDFAEQTLREKAQKKDVRLVCEQSDCTVYGSKALLESLCTNLCENAIRACEAGDEVRVSFREEEDGAVLRVADTGRGIAPEDLAHITEPFYRVDKARSRAEGGVGLGLYLCSEIVRIHGAVMAFDSKEGEGTTVTVRFPRQEQN